MGVEAAAIGVFDAGVDFDDGLDGVEARLARIASFGCDPVDLAGGCVGAGLDAAMLLGGRGAEIVLDIGFERRLVALEGEQVIGLVGDDLVGDLDFAAHGVDADERALELLGLREVIEQIRKAVISLVFSGTLSCARVSRAEVA